MKANRFKSPIVWLAAAGQIVLILAATGVVSIEMIDMIKIIATAAIEILTLFAVLNNPTNPNGF